MLKLLRGEQAKDEEPNRGRLISICSPYGSTGKTLVATNLSVELAKAKHSVLLIDFDFLGPSVANFFALTELPSGLPGALRIASQGRLDSEQLKRLSVNIPKTRLSILPSLSHPSNLDPANLENLIDTALEYFDFVVLDQSSLAAPDDPLTIIQLQLIRRADVQVIVVLADPIGIFRLLALQDQLSGQQLEPKILVNRLRNSVLSQARREITETLEGFGTYRVCAFLPDDPAHVDQAVRDGIPLAMGAGRGAFGQALSGFVKSEILGRKGRLESRVAKLG